MKVYYHLPGLFEFYDLYEIFLPLFYEHRDYFYDWCEIGSVYGAPSDCLWGGGRVGFGDADAKEVTALMREYSVSARLTFSNSLITKDHLSDKKCNSLLKDCLNNSIYSEISKKISKFGINASNIMRLNEVYPKNNIGCFIGDADCLTKFAPLYNKINQLQNIK